MSKAVSPDSPLGPPELGPVVSAAHLAAGAMPSLSELEFALNLSGRAFERWMVRCAAAAGQPGLTATEVLALHHVHHRNRDKTLAELCLLMNVEDTHLVNYALKKLTGLGLVATGKRGKEKTARATPDGEALCRRYFAIREKLLVEAARSLGFDEKEMSKLAALLRALSGIYDQAARSAASY